MITEYRVRRCFAVVSFIAFLASSAEAQSTWKVREYGGNACGCYQVTSADKSITILSNPNRTLKFEVYWSNSQGLIYYGPAPLNDITIAPGVTGNITIEIARNPSGPYNGPGEPTTIISTNGASVLARANLRRPNGGPADICILKKLRGGVLGNPDVASDSVDIDLWDGPITIGPSTPTEPSLPEPTLCTLEFAL